MPRKVQPPKKGRKVPNPPASRCNPKTLATIQRLAAHGFLAHEIADIIGIGRATMGRWKANIPEVTAALAIGHEAANSRVELSIYQMALGYDRDEEEIKVINGEVVRVPVRKYYPPSPAAAAMWARYKMSWGEDIAPAPATEAITDDTKPEVRQVARQVMRLLHLASKETAQ